MGICMAEAPTAVYTKGDYFTVKKETNSKLDRYLNSEAFTVLPPELKEQTRAYYEDKFASESEEVEGWKSKEFQAKIADWLKSYAPPVTDMRAVLRFVTLELAKECDTFEEHEANRKAAGYTADAYLELVKVSDGKPPIVSKEVRQRYAEQKETNKAKSNLPTAR